jgi:hypothetical protein
MTRKHTFPAGSYFIGDPCYAIENDKEWDEIGDATNWFGAEFFPSTPPPPKDWDDGLYHWNGKPCFASHTKYGDGVYFDGSHKQEYWVDSGLIGVTPLPDAFSKDKGLGFWLGGKIIDPKHSFEVWEENGEFHIGRMIIRT